MSPTAAAALAIAAYALAYKVYSGFLAKRLFELDEHAVTPAHALQDGVDYVPSRPLLLFGHQS